MTASLQVGWLPYASGWELLEGWLETKGRHVERAVKIDQRWTVTLAGNHDRYTSSKQLTLDSAIRTALMTAYVGGER